MFVRANQYSTPDSKHGVTEKYYYQRSKAACKRGRSVRFCPETVTSDFVLNLTVIQKDPI